MFGDAFGALGDGFGAVFGGNETEEIDDNASNRISTLGDGSCDWIFKPQQIRKLAKLANILLIQQRYESQQYKDKHQAVALELAEKVKTDYLDAKDKIEKKKVTIYKESEDGVEVPLEGY